MVDYPISQVVIPPAIGDVGTPSNLNPQRMLGGCLRYRTGPQSNGRARCDEENSAANSEVGRV
jgi:hypothetical protein